MWPQGRHVSLSVQGQTPDALSKTLKGNESNSEEMQAYLQKLATWRLQYRTAFLVVHHFRKSFRDTQGKRVPVSIQDLSGSSHLARDPDGFILLDVEPGATRGGMSMVLRHAEAIDWFKVERGEDLWWRHADPDSPDTEPTAPSNPVPNPVPTPKVGGEKFELACQLLRKLLLPQGPGILGVLAKTVEAKARLLGIGESTLKDARAELHVISKRVGRAWLLWLPPLAGGLTEKGATPCPLDQPDEPEWEEEE